MAGGTRMWTGLLLLVCLWGLTAAGRLSDALKKCEVTGKSRSTLLSYMTAFSQLSTLDQQLLDPEQLSYMNKLSRLVPLSGSLLGDILANGGELPFSFPDLGEEELLPALTSSREDGEYTSPYNDDIFTECNVELDSIATPFDELISCIVDAINPLKRPKIPKNKIPAHFWTLLDAAFKPPTGLLEGKLHWSGSYEQCLNFEANYTYYKTGVPRQYTGSYCRVKLKQKASNSSLMLSVGICLPDTCTSNSIVNYVNDGNLTIGLLNTLGLEIGEIFCGRDLDFSTDTRGHIALSISAIIAAIALFATIYDMCFRRDRISEYVAKHQPMTVGRPQMATAGTSNPSIPMQPISNGHAKPSGGKLNYVDVHPEDLKRYSIGSVDFEKALSNLSQVPSAAAPMPSTSAAVDQDCQVAQSSASSYNVLEEPASLFDKMEAAFAAFSVYNSIRRTFMIGASDKHHFRSLDCIRFFSYCTAMLGLVYLLGIIETEEWTTGNLLTFALNTGRTFLFQPVISFHLCVDSFLVLSGFLVTYHWMRRIYSKGGDVHITDVLLFYFHRYWRLGVPFMMILMFYTCLYEYFSDGPMNPPFVTDAENCRENWWVNLLMVGNLVKTETMCLSWTWYIPLVMQIHIIMPLILVPLIMVPIVGYAMLAVTFLAHVAVVSVMAVDMADNPTFDGWYHDYLMTPWCKAGPYLVGVALGIVMFKVRVEQRKIRIHPVLSLLGWVASLCVMSSMAFSTYSVVKEGGEMWTREETILVRAIGHIGWGLAIAWIIFATETGNSGVVGQVMRYQMFGPLARLSFMGFLASAIMVIRNTLVQLDLIYVTMNNQFFSLCGNLFISTVVGWALGLLYEHPFLGIESALVAETKYDTYMVASHPFLNDVIEVRPSRLYSTLEAVESAADLSQYGGRKPKQSQLYPNLPDSQASTQPPKYEDHFGDKKPALTTEL